MLDPWELVLHHTYAGTPGVIFDQSPGRASHGTAVNLTASDYLDSGAAPGSGAVTFPSDGMVRVPALPQSWSPLGGVRVEVVCRWDAGHPGGTLIDGGTFSYGLHGGFVGGGFSTSPGSSVFTTGGSPGVFLVPPDQWVTVGLVYDGFALRDCTVDGRSIDSDTAFIDPIDTPTLIVIGNDQRGNDGFSGLIDDVKVWRRNPHYIDTTFTDRPVDDATERCWVEWFRRWSDALAAHPECAERLNRLIWRAVAGLLKQGSGDPAVEAQWRAAADRYAELWRENRLDEIVPVLVDLVAFLRSQGFDPAQNADLAALLDDDCLGIFRAELPPMTCDGSFTAFLDSLTASLQ